MAMMCGKDEFLSERYYVMYGYMLSQFRLSSDVCRLSSSVWNVRALLSSA